MVTMFVWGFIFGMACEYFYQLRQADKQTRRQWGASDITWAKVDDYYVPLYSRQDGGATVHSNGA